MSIEVAAGVVGGISVVLVGHPFDTTKTRLQTAPSGFYSGTLDCVKKTLRIEGMRGFYSGITSPLSGQMFYRGCHFGTFYNTIDIMSRNNGILTPSTTQLMVAGAFTGFAVSFVEAPIDLLKTKLQVQIFTKEAHPQFIPKYTSLMSCTKYIIANNGYRALWQGLGATLIRNTPANALFFPVNELVKRKFAESDHCRVEDLAIQKKFVSGACAGLAYWVGTYPLDVVKARIQSMEYGTQQSWIQSFKTVYQINGWRSFTQGLVPCAMRAIPACATMFVTVDYVRNMLHRILDDNNNNNAN